MSSPWFSPYAPGEKGSLHDLGMDIETGRLEALCLCSLTMNADLRARFRSAVRNLCIPYVGKLYANHRYQYSQDQ